MLHVYDQCKCFRGKCACRFAVRAVDGLIASRSRVREGGRWLSCTLPLVLSEVLSGHVEARDWLTATCMECLRTTPALSTSGIIRRVMQQCLLSQR